MRGENYGISRRCYRAAGGKRYLREGWGECREEIKRGSLVK